MKDKLKLLKFPKTKQKNSRETIYLVLQKLENANNELEALEEILCGLIDFFSVLEDSEMIIHDLNKMRGAIEVFYEEY